MTRGQTSVVNCDGDDGFCGTWDLNYYEQGASSVDGIRVTNDAPAPGWTTRNGLDLCPDCSRGGGEA